MSESHKLIYIDHHPFPPGITRRVLSCNGFLHKTNVSTSELVLDFFKPPDRFEFIAMLGAIGDYQEHSRKMQKLIRRYGSRRAYMETLLLEQGLGVSREDHPFKRNVIQGLVRGEWPSEISGLIERARFAVRRERVIENHVGKNVLKVSKHIALVRDIPFTATGKAAIYVVRLADVDVGIAAYRDGDHIRLSMRRDEKSKVDLDEVIRAATLKVGGTGGGHKTAVGGRIPIRKFECFIKQVKREVSRQARQL